MKIEESAVLHILNQPIELARVKIEGGVKILQYRPREQFFDIIVDGTVIDTIDDELHGTYAVVTRKFNQIQKV